MILALIASNRDMKPWADAIRKEAPEIKVEIYPDISDPDQVTGAMLWNQPEGVLNQFPNLKWVSSLGAGVEHILSDPLLPEHVMVSRIVDRDLQRGMSRTVAMAVLNYYHEIYRYATEKDLKIWNPALDKPELKIGMLGLGVLGGASAQTLLSLGFEVFGYSRDDEQVSGVKTFGENELEEFLGEVNVLVNLLPLTPQTENILNYEFFSKCNRGTYLINLARGKHVVDLDLIKAIDEGRLSGAYLDVFREEPLPTDHPYWSHSKIAMTPHIASITNISSAATQIVENFRRLMKNEKLNNLVDKLKGY